MIETLSVEICGKTILTGEHSVLRGVPAIVLPIQSRRLKLKYKQTSSPLSLSSTGQRGPEGEMAVWGVLEKALQHVGKSRVDLSGEIHLKNELPVGVGLGASAALCVSIGRLMAFRGWIKNSELFDFSRQLEDTFHGESSGVDIAVAISGEPIVYQREEGARPISISWLPNLCLSYSGQRGVTSECVQKVKELINIDPALGRDTDAKMHEATELAIDALKDSNSGSDKLAESLSKANECFETWQLVTPSLAKELQRLKALGALASKPTGSGGGGHCLSLFPATFKDDSLIRVLS